MTTAREDELNDRLLLKEEVIRRRDLTIKELQRKLGKLVEEKRNQTK